jgi:hypothetical protein
MEIAPSVVVKHVTFAVDQGITPTGMKNVVSIVTTISSVMLTGITYRITVQNVENGNISTAVNADKTILNIKFTGITSATFAKAVLKNRKTPGAKNIARTAERNFVIMSTGTAYQTTAKTVASGKRKPATTADDLTFGIKSIGTIFQTSVRTA